MARTSRPDTDTVIASALAARLGAARPETVVLAPAVPYGSSGEHAGFPGTLSIGQQALELLVIELVRDATRDRDRVLIVNAHGGNIEPLSRAIGSCAPRRATSGCSRQSGRAGTPTPGAPRRR